MLRWKSLFSKEEDDLSMGRTHYIINALDKLPKFSWEVSRGINLSNKELSQYIQDLQVWDSYQDSAFLSTTKWSQVSKSFEWDVEFHIQSKTGVDISNLSIYSSREKEILFKPNTVFRITKKEIKNNKYFIDMEEIEDQSFKEQINIANELWQIYDQQLENLRKSYK